ncbi:hypothetical protein CSUI_008892 [Cystoisospora suis]|uniref:Uncharacterized protein n=1 Tax=Cystoisospora suis TaxID=483139 RepID=A0A2C6K6T9_9APIC|nr:hypothetical protein CSUI_008892 [Cystoisospora suis]
MVVAAGDGSDFVSESGKHSRLFSEFLSKLNASYYTLKSNSPDLWTAGYFIREEKKERKSRIVPPFGVQILQRSLTLRPLFRILAPTSGQFCARGQHYRQFCISDSRMLPSSDSTF